LVQEVATPVRIFTPSEYSKLTIFFLISGKIA